MKSRSELKTLAKKQLSKNVYWNFVIAVAIYVVICFGVGILQAEFSLSSINSLVSIFLIVPLSLGFFYAALRVKEGKFHICSFLYFISRGIKRYLKIVLLGIILNIIINVGLILLIVPGIIWGLMFSQAIFIISEKDCGVFEALSESQKLMRGHKWEFFKFVLSFILWYALILITAGIATIFVLPYIVTAYANYYAELKAENEYKNPQIYRKISTDE